MAYNLHEMTREIGIDMGHRVTFHGSKCKNLHGHRYTIQATLIGPLAVGGEQDGMVMDFGFLKEAMLTVIDAKFDHGLCLWVDDPLLRLFLEFEHSPRLDEIRQEVNLRGWAFFTSHAGKTAVLHCVPTAENLARVWWEMLHVVIANDPRNTGASVIRVRVYETPNCWADYCPS